MVYSRTLFLNTMETLSSMRAESKSILIPRGTAGVCVLCVGAYDMDIEARG